MTTTTTDHPTTTALAVETARRDRTLRLLLTLAGVHGLPLFDRISFSEFEHRGETLRTLNLHLPADTDVTGWADALGATRLHDMPVTGDTHEWVVTIARTEWSHGPGVDWHQTEVQARRDYRPRTDRRAELDT